MATSFETIENATSLQALPAGRSPCASPAGRKAPVFGPEAAHVSHLAEPENEREQPTNGTSGQSFTDLSPSAALQSSLESRLRARMDVNGSPEYVLTWKHWDMPSGVPICALRARARRISDKDFGGWPSPRATDGARTVWNPSKGGGNVQLDRMAAMWLTGWPTPDANVFQNTESPESFNSRRATLKAKKINGNGCGTPLAMAVRFAGWASPACRDYRYPNKKSYQERSSSTKGEQLNNQVVHGLTTPLSTAPMAPRGVLAPEFSRWLMGFPSAWDAAAPHNSEWQSVQQELIESAG
jgi:hypothetical protein